MPRPEFRNPCLMICSENLDLVRLSQDQPSCVTEWRRAAQARNRLWISRTPVPEHRTLSETPSEYRPLWRRYFYIACAPSRLKHRYRRLPACMALEFESVFSGNRLSIGLAHHPL